MGIAAAVCSDMSPLVRSILRTILLPILRPLGGDGVAMLTPCLGQERPMPAPRRKTWDATLRGLIKTEHGFGWSLRGHRGKVQLTHRFEDGTRSAVRSGSAWMPMGWDWRRPTA